MSPLHNKEVQFIVLILVQLTNTSCLEVVNQEYKLFTALSQVLVQEIASSFASCASVINLLSVLSV